MMVDLSLEGRMALTDGEIGIGKARVSALDPAGADVDVAVSLASPAGAYLTGSSVTIDGGRSLLLGQGA